MEIAERAHATRSKAIRDYDRWITVGYLALALVAATAVYFASGAPSFTAGDLAVMAAMP